MAEISPGSQLLFTDKPLGDRSSDPQAPPPAAPKRQEECQFPASATGADSFWVRQDIWKPYRPGNDCIFLIDGEEAMAAISKEMAEAKKFIYITDWCINPSVHLIRNGKLDPEKNTLLAILKKAATSGGDDKTGVQVRIMLWESNTTFANNHDKEAEDKFAAASKNIQVCRDPAGHTYWSHHQKTVVVDGRVAFLGGVDLCSGRWDTHQHPVFGDPSVFDDGDFYNSCVSPRELLDKDKHPRRSEFPRMPWHDVHLRVAGPAAHDVESNFVQRWNFHNKGMFGKKSLTESSPEPAPGAGKRSVQIIRSVSKLTAGVAATENSIGQAYVQAIKNAQQFIYIENQYFTSNFGGGKPSNGVANAIAQRVIKAIDKKETFRVIIVLPVHPEGVLGDSETLDTMFWQKQTINRSGAGSLVGQIRQKLGGDAKAVNDYIGFFNLRGYHALKDCVLTEQIYVHAKLMIVDDNIAIIGSANINDRSLLGDRDSELSAIVRDEDWECGQMDGKPKAIRDFAHSLRVKLWQEHLGLGDGEKGDILDPIHKDVYEGKWWKTARENTQHFEQVFPNIPSNKFHTLAEQAKARAFENSNVGALKNIKGHLTLYPLEWLDQQDMSGGGLFENAYTFNDAPASNPTG